MAMGGENGEMMVLHENKLSFQQKKVRKETGKPRKRVSGVEEEKVGVWVRVTGDTMGDRG